MLRNYHTLCAIPGARLNKKCGGAVIKKIREGHFTFFVDGNSEQKYALQKRASAISTVRGYGVDGDDEEA